ncbi:hypothetical protein F4604DRAFT_1903646, partial [Suillus subluteus]
MLCAARSSKARPLKLFPYFGRFSIAALQVQQWCIFSEAVPSVICACAGAAEGRGITQYWYWGAGVMRKLSTDVYSECAAGPHPSLFGRLNVVGSNEEKIEPTKLELKMGGSQTTAI